MLFNEKMGKMESGVNDLKHVLLADDDPDQAILFRVVLRQNWPSQKLTVASNGQELLEQLDKQVPDLIFLDLNMPCVNGFECLDRIRAQAEFRKIPVVVYSSSSDMSDIAKSYLHKADLYMVKPFSSLHLKNALDSILRMEWWKNEGKGQKLYFINNRFVPFTASA
jgi:CheY-like chemotaxis protein